ncbi:MAG: KH domain-containing protein [Fimbriimonadaceae bacterium]|nr:KH domain-containing protein [Fimbriimonadaceae bacterium]
MEAIETTGKDLRDALAQAASQLGVDSGTLAHEVLEETAGLFGKSTVRIRAWVAPEASTDAEPAPVIEKPKAVRKKAAPKAPPTPPVEASVEAAPTEPEDAEADSESFEEPEEEERPNVVATAEDADNILAIVDNLLKSAHLTARARVRSMNDRYVNVELDGRDVAFLIGKRGEALNALQYLVNIIVGRKLANGVRCTLDGNDYRKDREQKLTHLAQSIAREVRKRGEEAVLDALPAFERRIVHKALLDFAGISTYSEGEEPNRRVVIAPAD